MENDADNPFPTRRSDSVPMRTASTAGLPPHPLDKQWFVHVDGQTYGPYSGHDIRKMADKE